MASNERQAAIIDCYFHRSIFFIWFQLFESTASALSFVQPFHLSGIVHTAAFKQANQIFTLSVSLPSSMTPHTTLLLSHPLFIKTPQESSHTGLQLSDLQLFFCLACVSTILCNGFIITVTSFQHTCVNLVEKLSSGFPSSLKNIFVVKKMEVVLMDFSSVFALITALNPSVIQILYITHTHVRMHTVIGTPNHISAVPSSRSPHSRVSASENEMYSTAHTPCKRKSPFLFFSEENKLTCILPHLMSTHMPVQRPSTHPWPR